MPEGSMQEASLPPNATPKEEFDLGYGYVLHKNYGPAEQTFRDFVHKFPGDRLTPEAQYWLGESLFQDQKYHDAAEAFLTVSTKYETSGKAPDALLRLGQSLAALGEKEAACASLGEVLRKYPHASLAVKQNVDREQKRVHC
jgi:tol-pal system protein YbgF